jgi:VanZ family protein
MPIELNFQRLACLTAAVAMMLAILIGAPLPIPAGWDKAAHFVAFSALTFCLWQATGGRMALFVLGALIVFGALDEWRQAYLPERSSDAKDFLADLCAVLATGALLFIQGKNLCAESSPQ